MRRLREERARAPVRHCDAQEEADGFFPPPVIDDEEAGWLEDWMAGCDPRRRAQLPRR